MELEEIVIFIVTGGVAGWLAGLILRRGNIGIIGNIIVGVIGAFIGSWLFGKFEIHIGNEYVNALVASTTGAVILLLLLSLIGKKKR